MTEQQACTLCGAGGHTAAQCTWNQGATAFQREDRYIVIKRKDLSHAPFAAVHSLFEHLRGLGKYLPEREYVVIESDWPEYEAAWRMIEARITGAALAQPSPAPELERERCDLRNKLALANLKESSREEQAPLLHINPLVVEELLGLRRSSPGGLTYSKEARGSLTFALYAAPVAQAGQVPEGWRVMRCTSSIQREGDKWEIYDPQGSGGVVSTHDVKDWAVRGLLDALAAAPAQGASDEQ